MENKVKKEGGARLSLSTPLVIKPVKRTPRQQLRVKLLLSIVNRGDDVLLKEILDEHSISLGYSFAAMGTAHSAVLDYLGIGASEKAVVFSLVPESDEELLLKELHIKLYQYRGRGISFTIPVSGVSEIVAGKLTGAASVKLMDRRKIMHEEDRKYDLIVAAVASGHVDEAIEAARAAGAAGGTIIRARSVGNAKAEQFIGISLTKEQELLLILARREGKFAIMQAIMERCGLKTEAEGVIFSLPVDRTAGIASVEEPAGENRDKTNG